jgi:hypothetical protein
MSDPWDRPVAPVLMELAEAASGAELRSIVLMNPVILSVDLATLSQVLRAVGQKAGAGPVVTAVMGHRARVFERLATNGLAGMTPDQWSQSADSDWVLPLSLAQILDEVAVKLRLAADRPDAVTPEDLVETCLRAWNHPAMLDAPAIVRAGVGRDYAVALRRRLRARPDPEQETLAARLESEARDLGINF